MGSKGQVPFHHLSHKTELNSLSPITATFRQIRTLEDFSPSADEAWHQAALTPKGGFLWVEYNETTNAAYGISMFHALHCLQMLRMVVRESPKMKALWSKPGHRGEGEMEMGEGDHERMDPVHMGHCIGYIAQVGIHARIVAGETAGVKC